MPLRSTGPSPAAGRWLTRWFVLPGFLLALTACGPDVTVEDITHDERQGDRVAGIWEGSLETGVSLRLVFRVAVNNGQLAVTLDSPDQGAYGLRVDEARFDGEQFALKLARLGASFAGRLVDDRHIEGAWHQRFAELPLNLTKVDQPTAILRPQTPTPPFPYRDQSVTFRSNNGDATLSGTLTLPPGAGPFPAAVLVSGSGLQDRDETLFGHKPFLVIADHLTRHGIAVLRYDDRGFGKSTGDPTTATTATFAQDAIGAVQFLAARDDVRSVGLIGHSEGAAIADELGRRALLDWAIRLAGPGVSGKDLLGAQVPALIRASGGDEALVDAAMRVNGPLYALAHSQLDEATLRTRASAHLDTVLDELGEDTQRRLAIPSSPEQMLAPLLTPWFRTFLRHDPTHDLRGANLPILALFGSKDVQVPPDQNLEPVKAALVHPDSRTKVFAGLNHLFQTADRGAPREYATIEETMAPEVLSEMRTFIAAVERGQGAAR